ncbi:unnamed protein product [Gordionus sp. m RMFG-2023]
MASYFGTKGMQQSLSITNRKPPLQLKTLRGYYAIDKNDGSIILKFGGRASKIWDYVNEKDRNFELNLIPKLVFDLGVKLSDTIPTIQTDLRLDFNAARTYNPSYIIVRYLNDLSQSYKLCIDSYVRPPGYTSVVFDGNSRVRCYGKLGRIITGCGKCGLPFLAEFSRPFIIEKIIMLSSGDEYSRSNLGVRDWREYGNTYNVMGSYYYISFKLNECSFASTDYIAEDLVTTPSIVRTPIARVKLTDSSIEDIVTKTTKRITYELPSQTTKTSTWWTTKATTSVTLTPSFDDIYSGICGRVTINKTITKEPFSTGKNARLIPANQRIKPFYSSRNKEKYNRNRYLKPHSRFMGGRRRKKPFPKLYITPSTPYWDDYQTEYPYTEEEYTPYMEDGYEEVFGRLMKRSTLEDEDSNKKKIESRIFGGTVSLAGAWPWQTSIRWRGEHICGGFLISDRHVVSAAHCFLRVNIHELTVHLGTLNKNGTDKTEQIRRVVKLFRHLYFNKIKRFDSDVALLHLNEPVVFNEYISPICLPKIKPTKDLFCQVTGYGTTKGAGKEYVLNEIAVPIIPNYECNQPDWLNDRVTENMLCAGGELVDACSGDSGGPLECLGDDDVWYATGIVSWGIDCGKPMKPGVYTRLITFVNWIKDKMNQ